MNNEILASKKYDYSILSITFQPLESMSPIEFSFQVILLSTSGVLSPGPLFFINILYGSKYGSFVGLKIALGHTIAEFPLIIILSYVLYTFSSFHVSDII